MSATGDGRVARVVLLRSVAVLAATLAAAASVVVLARAAEPGAPRPSRRATSRHAGLAADVCTIAGSGSNLPLVRALVREHRRLHPSDRFVVHDSIGSGGGIRATADGVVHLGLVSRPLKKSELRSGLQAILHAYVPVVLAGHPGVPDRALSSTRLADLVRGGDVRWSDGTHTIWLEREQGDSSLRVLLAHNAPFRRADRDRRGHTHWRVLLHDPEMIAALRETTGAVGLADLGVLLLSPPALPILRIDGLDPLAQDYPYLKELSFVVRGAPTGVTARFLELVRSPAGRALATSAGYRVPAAPGRRSAATGGLQSAEAGVPRGAKLRGVERGGGPSGARERGDRGGAVGSPGE